MQYYDPGDAAHAKDRLDGYNLDGRNISVLYAQASRHVCKYKYTLIPYHPHCVLPPTLARRKPPYLYVSLSCVVRTQLVSYDWCREGGAQEVSPVLWCA